MEPIKTLGTFLNGTEQRDAIHIAILPVIAAEPLRPGDHVNFAYGTTDQVKRRDPAYALPAVGVIDPFLTEWGIKKGQRVWLFMYPNTITGLRHEWTHPALTAKQPKNDSEKWLHEFADRWNFDYSEMIRAASAPSGPGEYDYNYITAQGIDLHSKEELGEDHDLFWHHLSVLTGQHFAPEHREKFSWSCTC